MFSKLLPVLLSFVLIASGLQAQTAQEQIVLQLQEQGFDRISVSRTLLGRIRIRARGDEYRREIIFNPSTGAILRDYWFRIDLASSNGNRDSGGPSLVDPNSYDDYDDDDDDHDDKDRDREEDRDNSGSGGSGGGHGDGDDDD